MEIKIVLALIMSCLAAEAAYTPQDVEDCRALALDIPPNYQPGTKPGVSIFFTYTLVTFLQIFWLDQKRVKTYSIPKRKI